MHSLRGPRPQILETAHELVPLLAFVQHRLLQFLNLGLQLGHLAVVLFIFKLLFQLHYSLVLLDQLLLQFELLAFQIFVCGFQLLLGFPQELYLLFVHLNFIVLGLLLLEFIVVLLKPQMFIVELFLVLL